MTTPETSGSPWDTNQIIAGLFERIRHLSGGGAVVFQGPVQPDLSGVAAGTEYLWWKTDGNGNILDLLSGVKQ